MSNIDIAWEYLCLAAVIPAAIALIIWAIKSEKL